MILRRVIEHVKTQNWTAVALDFVIVVVGVFIGIQLGNWNEQRAEHARAMELRERLAEDFGAIAEATETSVSRVEFFTDAAEEVYAVLIAGEHPDDEEAFGRLINVAGSSHPSTGASPTFAEMLSTGDLGLIKNDSLRTALVEYHQLAAQNEKIWQSFLPLLFEQLHALDDYVVWSEVNPQSGFPEIEDYDFDALTGQARIFRRMARLNSNLMQLYSLQRELADAVLLELQANKEGE
ncbi:MAG: hypothetical protein Tsb0010_08010 [Parvularculaceae bacterium]